MAWDDIKSTLESRPDVPDDKKLTAAEWNAMTADQQARGYDTVATVTADHTAVTQSLVLADASGGPVTVTLPGPTSATVVTVKKIDSSANAVTIATPGSETIDGDSNRTLTAQWVAREVASDGTNYYLI